MAYRVDISPAALGDAEEAYLWIKDRSPEKAGDWYEGLLESIFSLESLPLRCPMAPESEYFTDEVRQLLYGKHGNLYRILFNVRHDENENEDIVRVFRIWHGARDRIEIDEFRKGESKS